jgi:hypothetical protein
MNDEEPGINSGMRDEERPEYYGEGKELRDAQGDSLRFRRGR